MNTRKLKRFLLVLAAATVASALVVGALGGVAYLLISAGIITPKHAAIALVVLVAASHIYLMSKEYDGGILKRLAKSFVAFIVLGALAFVLMFVWLFVLSLLFNIVPFWLAALPAIVIGLWFLKITYDKA